MGGVGPIFLENLRPGSIRGWPLNRSTWASSGATTWASPASPCPRAAWSGADGLGAAFFFLFFLFGLGIGRGVSSFFFWLGAFFFAGAG